MVLVRGRQKVVWSAVMLRSVWESVFVKVFVLGL